MDEFRTLLNRFWVRRSEDRELFYQLRRKLPAMRGVLREQFGWEVTCTEEVIRLVKQPAKASPAFGIRSFTAVSDYSLLCGLLLVLEDKDDGQRFLLSELTQAIQAHVKPFMPSLSWERYQYRTSLVRVLQYAEQIGLVRSCERRANDSPPTRSRRYSTKTPAFPAFSASIFTVTSAATNRCRISSSRRETPPTRSGAFFVPIGYSDN